MSKRKDTDLILDINESIERMLPIRTILNTMISYETTRPSMP
jgi:hypothetical protein